MFSVRMRDNAGLEEFRRVARRALALKVSPQALQFCQTGEATLFPALPDSDVEALTAPRAFAESCGRAFAFDLSTDLMRAVSQSDPAALARIARNGASPWCAASQPRTSPTGPVPGRRPSCDMTRKKPSSVVRCSTNSRG